MKVVAAALLAAAGAAPAGPPKLDMLSFFAGRSHADNVIRIAFHAPHKLNVESVGGHNKEGDFVLIDTVAEEGRPVRKRMWVIKTTGPDRFAGVLSDAAGPVDIAVSGDSATIRYTMKEGHLKVTQQVTLQPDGRTLENHVVAKKLGIAFAHVDGTIHKLD